MHWVKCLTFFTCRLAPADIKAGQGLYYSTITGSWRARNCVNDNYGVPNTTYGLTPAPCK
jgi:hypothetical protein